MKIELTYQEAKALQKAITERAGNFDHNKHYGDLHFDLLASAYRKLDRLIKDELKCK